MKPNYKFAFVLFGKMFVRAQNTARLTKNNVILIVLMLVSLGQCLPSPKIIKRMAVEDNGAMEYPDYQTGVQYDEYPVSFLFFFMALIKHFELHNYFDR